MNSETKLEQRLSVLETEKRSNLQKRRLVAGVFAVVFLLLFVFSAVNLTDNSSRLTKIENARNREFRGRSRIKDPTALRAHVTTLDIEVFGFAALSAIGFVKFALITNRLNNEPRQDAQSGESRT